MGGKHSEYKEVKTADYLNGDVYGSGAHGQETMMAFVDKEDQSGKVRFLTEILDDFRRFVDEIWRF